MFLGSLPIQAKKETPPLRSNKTYSETHILRYRDGWFISLASLVRLKTRTPLTSRGQPMSHKLTSPSLTMLHRQNVTLFLAVAYIFFALKVIVGFSLHLSFGWAKFVRYLQNKSGHTQSKLVMHLEAIVFLGTLSVFRACPEPFWTPPC